MAATISVIIPVRNSRDYLDKCMESVLGQTFTDIEVILAENKSTDGSVEMCDGYAAKDSRVRVLHLDTEGQSAARNAALDVCTAPLVCFIDSDDHVETDMLASLHELMTAYQADIVCSNFFYEHDGVARANEYDDGKVMVLDKRGTTEKFLSMEINNSPWSKLIKRSLFDGLRFPEGRLYEDHAIMHRLAYRCDKAVWLRKSYYYYVQHDGSTVHTKTPKKIYDFFLADYDRYRFIGEHRVLLEGDTTRLTNLEAMRCFKHFRTFMRDRRSDGCRRMRDDMIVKLSDMSHNEKLKPKLRRRLWAVRRAYWLFYLIHVALRRK